MLRHALADVVHVRLDASLVRHPRLRERRRHWRDEHARRAAHSAAQLFADFHFFLIADACERERKSLGFALRIGDKLEDRARCDRRGNVAALQDKYRSTGCDNQRDQDDAAGHHSTFRKISRCRA
jgi:hypothetical protein